MVLHFLVDDLGPETSQVVLTGTEAHHAASVRRVRVGERVTVGDGRGGWATGACDSVSAREVVVRLAQFRLVPPPTNRIVLVQALAKGDRDELAVQAATELGIDEIVPWQAARSVSRWDEAKARKGVARWSAISREAAKQAHRAWVPDVTSPVTTSGLATRAADALVLVLEPTASLALSARVRASSIEPGRDLVLVVGPEGGITPEELAALEQAGADLVRLGETVLRTSTAGPAALAVVSVALGRW